MEKYIGRTVRLYQGNGSYQEAVLLSTRGPGVRDQRPDPHGPPGPGGAARPAREPGVQADAGVAPAEHPARRAARGGLVSHRRDQLEVGLRDADQRQRHPDRPHLLGDHHNQSGGTYRDAALKLVAGDINRARAGTTRGGRSSSPPRRRRSPTARRDFKSEGFFEYHLYTLDGRTTIKDKQTKQLSLLSAADVPVEKRFIYYGAAATTAASTATPISNQKVGVYLELKNSKENRLGRAAAQGQGPRVQGGRRRQPAVDRRGLDRPHPEGREA